MKIIIYSITNIINNKLYVGSTNNLIRRRYSHFYELSKKIHGNKYLQYSYDKYGKDNLVFSILEECNIDNRLEREIYWINKLKTFDDNYGYNLYIPNKNGFTCRDEIKLKLQIAHQKTAISIDVYSIDGKYLNTFNSVNSCSIYYSMKTSSIIFEVLNKKRKSYKGLVFVKKGEIFNYTKSSKTRDMTKFYKK